MKKILLATVGVMALGAAPALAADLPARVYTKAPPVVAPIYNWGGFYIGLNAGGGSAHDSSHIAVLGIDVDLGSHDATGGLVGGQIGYRWQSTNWVFGLEAQGDWADLKGSHDLLAGLGLPAAAISRSKVDALGLFTGQIGYAWNNVLWYVKGGAAVTDNRYDVDFLGVNVLHGSDTRWGGTVGTGLEIGFAPNWSVAFEYDHIFLDHHDVAYNTVPGGIFVGDVSHRGDVDLGTVRVNYTFGGPIVAKY